MYHKGFATDGTDRNEKDSAAPPASQTQQQQAAAAAAVAVQQSPVTAAMPEICDPSSLGAALADPKMKQQALVEINRSLLDSYYTFKPNAPLKSYIQSKVPPNERRDHYTLAEVLIILKGIIRDERMFDPKNPAIIMCSKELDDALNMRALHVTEIRELVASQLLRLPERFQVMLRMAAAAAKTAAQQSDLNSSTSSGGTAALPPATVSEPKTSVVHAGGAAAVAPPTPAVAVAKIDPAVFADKSSRFELKSEFRAVLASLPDFDQSRTRFSYEEVTLLLSKYILSKKETFFDPRNIKLALVANDPLGQAFQVNSFHRCQVTSLLRKQLIHVLEDGSEATSSVLVQSPAMPPFPALTKAATLPPNNRCLDNSGSQAVQPPPPPATTTEISGSRKRACSGEEGHSKQSRLSDSLNERSNSAAASEPEQDSQEEEGEDEEEEEESEEENEEENEEAKSEAYEVEYDIDSGEEQEERPPQAGGGSESSEEDSDLECHSVPIQEVEQDPTESDNWADSETELNLIGGEAAAVDPSDLKKDHIECTRCRTPTEEAVPYCDGCYQSRKSWLPERPVPRYRTRRQRDEFRDRLRQHRASSDETDGGGACVHTIGSSSDSGFGSQELDTVDVAMVDEAMPAEAKNTLGSKELTDTGEEHSDPSNTGALALNKSISLKEWSPINMATSDMLLDVKNLQTPVPVPASVLEGLFAQAKTSAVPPQQLCMLCCLRPKNASLIHGRIGHQVCCYPCGKKLWKKQSRCPVCRRKVEKIVKIILA